MAFIRVLGVDAQGRPQDAPSSVARGFTAIELLIVLAIIGILAGIVALNLRPFSNHAENGASALAAGFSRGPPGSQS